MSNLISRRMPEDLAFEVGFGFPFPIRSFFRPYHGTSFRWLSLFELKTCVRFLPSLTMSLFISNEHLVATELKKTTVV